MVEIDFKKLIIPHFYSLWVADNYYTTIVSKGGRDSGKTCQIALKIIYKRMKTLTSALAIRKVANTVRDSIFQDLKWAIRMLNVEHLWKSTVSPMALTYIPTGTQILMRGAENPERIKGIKSKFPITDLWIDELSEFKQEDELDTIEDSVLRSELNGGLKYTFFYSYNPPKRKSSWVNKKFNSLFLHKNIFVHHSTVFQNIYASRQIIEKALQMKKSNLNKYRWIYLGEAIGGGIIPFENLSFETIQDITMFDNIRQGIDWGYAVDAFCFGRMHYDKKKQHLYFIDELHNINVKEREMVSFIKNNKYTERIIADSAEPKSISSLKDHGINIIGAKKGPGSVEFGEKWLNELEKIIIDYRRTPKIAKEFEDIDYKIDRYGEVMSQLEDKNNHSIDMTRYAMENDMRDSAGVW